MRYLVHHRLHQINQVFHLQTQSLTLENQVYQLYFFFNFLIGGILQVASNLILEMHSTCGLSKLHQFLKRMQNSNESSTLRTSYPDPFFLQARCCETNSSNRMWEEPRRPTWVRGRMARGKPVKTEDGFASAVSLERKRGCWCLSHSEGLAAAMATVASIAVLRIALTLPDSFFKHPSITWPSFLSSIFQSAAATMALQCRLYWWRLIIGVVSKEFFEQLRLAECAIGGLAIGFKVEVQVCDGKARWAWASWKISKQLPIGSLVRSNHQRKN